MSESQEFCLRWSSYQQQLSEALRSLLERELLVDVTLACDGRSLRAHRTILSACSNYFQELFQESSHPHPIVILKDVRFDELQALVRFMYHGEVTMNNESLPGFLRTAETLQIRGLTGGAFPCHESKQSKVENDTLQQELSLQEDSNSTDNHDLSGVESTNDMTRESSPEPKRIKIEHRPTSKSAQVHSSVHQYTNEGNVSITSLDGLSQLVLPVLQEESSTSSQFVVSQGTGLCQTVLPGQQQNINNHNLMNRPFRHRVLWNHDQLLQLESWYRSDRYPAGQTMRHYADTLASMCPTGPSPTRQNVDYWFQNRRRKDSHPEVMQQREKKKMAKTLWGQILDQRGQSGT